MIKSKPDVRLFFVELLFFLDLGTLNRCGQNWYTNIKIVQVPDHVTYSQQNCTLE